jgi:hypothetical protein
MGTFKKTEITAVGIYSADLAKPLFEQLLLNSLTNGAWSVDIFRSRTKATELFIVYICVFISEVKIT